MSNSGQKSYLTQEGFDKLKEELQFLKTDKRKDVAQRLSEAIEMGDLSENAAYDEAKDASAKLEQRIAELEVVLKNAEIISTEGGDTSTVKIGATIVVKDPSGKDKTFTIVGKNEVDIALGKISNESPIGNAFLGRKVKEKITVKTPRGEVEYKIKSISY